MNNSVEIVHEDEQFVVVNKPGGLLSVPGRGPEKQDCLTARVKNIFPDCIKQPAVHRLDMATSGLLVVALTEKAHRNLSQQFFNRSVVKRYVGLLEGHVVGEEGCVTLSFRLNPDNRPYQVYDPVQGKEGVTRWRIIKREKGLTRVEFFPHTGRTHQLRLHSSHLQGLSCPVKGDALYGTGRDGDKMYLHAAGLQFDHPESRQSLCFISYPDF